MLALRPRMRIAWWAAVLATAAAYVFRAVVVFGGDFRPQMPTDAIIGVVLAGLLVVRILVAKSAARDVEDEDPDLTPSRTASPPPPEPPRVP
jgi:hypothetical protein